MGEIAKPASLRSVVLTTRILIFSLLVGIMFFGAFVLMNRPDPVENADRTPVLTYTAFAMSLVCVLLSFVVPRILVRSQCQAIAENRFQTRPQAQHSTNPYHADMDSDEGKLAMVFQTKTIVAAALLEGAAFFAMFAYWQEQQVAALAVVGVLLVLLLLKVPLTANVQLWLENRLREVQQQRDLAGVRRG